MMADQNQATDQTQDIFKLLGLELLPTEEKIKLLQKLEVAAREQVINLILEQLSDKDCRDLDALLKGGAKEEDILVFLRERISNLDDLVKQRIDIFKSELVKEVQSIRKEIQDIQDNIAQSAEDAKQSTGKQTLREELKQIEREIQEALKKGDFDAMQKLMARSKEVKARLL